MPARSKPAEVLPVAPETPLAPEDVLDFMGITGEERESFDREPLEAAIASARKAAEDFVGQPLPPLLNSHYRQGVLLTVVQLLLSEAPGRELRGAEAPAVARYFWTLGAAA